MKVYSNTATHAITDACVQMFTVYKEQIAVQKKSCSAPLILTIWKISSEPSKQKAIQKIKIYQNLYTDWPKNCFFFPYFKNMKYDQIDDDDIGCSDSTNNK